MSGGGPLSEAEQRQLQELLDRAQIAAEARAASTEGWSLMTEGSMSDASKRRLTEIPLREPFAGAATMEAMVEPVLPPVDELPMTAGYVSTAAPAPMPETVTTGPQFGFTPRGTAIHLPPGVESLDRWGQSLVDFGKYQSKGWTYAQMFASTDSQVKSYVKWCKSQVDAMEGFVRDLGLYFIAVEYTPGQHPVIPGTTQARRFRLNQ